MFKLSLFVLFLIICDIAIASDVQQKHETLFINQEKLNKKLLPNVKHLLKEKSDGYRQQFLRLLNNLEVDGYKFVNDTPFTIIIPKISFDATNIDKNTIQQLIFEHIIPGVQLKKLKDEEIYGNMNQNPVEIKNQTLLNKWQVNDIDVLKFNRISAKLISFIEIDGCLNDKKNNYVKRNIQEHNSYNEPQKLVQKNANKTDISEKAKEIKTGLLQNYLSTMKSGTKVFQHFLKSSNLSTILEDATDNFIILVPSDTAFQRWQPIDWGFFPFSVPEFTESIMQNHVVQLKQPLNLKSIENELKLKALGGEFITFRNLPKPSVNNVPILSNATLSNGNDVYMISEVLFMTDAKVSKLHQMNKDKETPPLLAFPWFNSQFLSHSFLALEKDNRFTQIARFLNSADIAPFIPGSNYTFFVPFDEAFEKYEFDELSDDVLSSNKSINFILNHFVKGRLYNRDLNDGETFETIGGQIIKIKKDYSGNKFVNQATIVESEVFVYNLGTMFYIDDVLYPEVLHSDYKNIQVTKHTEHENDSSEELFTTEMPEITENDEIFNLMKTSATSSSNITGNMS
ncbi:hypothetical protein PVAND_004884 [Polypedilum vanderplanki]|uniref:FAS1 domain-containing protein n=1 Tax=Polypedilum vanderplanki TaxID=319348 RepID=A0A9J6BYH5_POLVA|nr:hypothetical protein PVAND_004884 [Polypedilum vanderplanki]